MVARIDVGVFEYWAVKGDRAWSARSMAMYLGIAGVRFN